MKFLRYLPLVTALVIIGSCVSYKKVSMGDAPARSQQLRDNYSGYDFYVYDGNKTYSINNHRLEGETVYGDLDDITGTEQAKNINEYNIKGANNDNKRAIVLHTKKSVSDIADSLRSVDDQAMATIMQNESAIALRGEDIQEVKGYALDEGDLGGKILIGLLIVIGAALIIWGSILVSNSANNSSNSNSNSQSGSTQPGGSSEGNSSEWSSDASGSNNSSDASNTSSDGSNGSSDSSGSCYVATMVYGSYDAPEVLVLRKFRDNVLQKSFLGRAFIKFYYKYSPYFVEQFKSVKWVNDLIRFQLNIFVNFIKKVLR